MLPEPSTFLSGEPRGHVGARAKTAYLLRDRALDLRAQLAGVGKQLDAIAAEAPARDVLILSLYRPPAAALVKSMGALRSERHRVEYAFGSLGAAIPPLAEHTVATDMTGGKFPNLNELLPQFRNSATPQFPDWTLVIDDDVRLPERFLDRFVGLCERFDLALAQPAQSLRSHAAWSVARRRPGSLLRETRFVEIGPVTAFRRDAAAELLPFPALRYGWGLDVHWAAVAEQRGWKLGIADALPVRHEEGEVGTTYSADAAVTEAQEFLATRPYVTSDRAQETLAVHPLR